MLKRAFDLAVSLLLLVLSAPFLLIIAVAIKLDSPGPVFYRATRIGQGGEPFKLYKFRSMVSDADKQGPGITTAGDSRITRVGAVLRRTKLDELPQVLNI
ncbi:MAG: sugar transferase, partial [Chloroflexi bacterium]|nr:sugar transferase [Chloroflexota bacterium]